MNYVWKCVCIAGMVSALAACNAGVSIEGQWVEPIPGMEGVQGFMLEKGGKASSINMATLKYEAWEQNGQQLILSGESIGNGVSGSFSDTLTIERLTPDSLILKNGMQFRKYSRPVE
ncbi:hypothetical protein B5F34_10335 [Mediterranea sp. An20]|nr:lipocalin family protein [Mediterranea sp. An20]OUP07737.1 hypothetical protein B5F34_10335 [Mediterranea sp. An20]